MVRSLIPGLYFLAFYVVLWRDLRAIKVFPEFPSRRDHLRDILLSQVSIAVFGAVLVLMMLNRRFFYLEDHDPWHHGAAHVGFCVVYLVGAHWPPMRTRVVADIDARAVMHDVYFYATHRLLHTRPLYKWVHSWHHRAHNPSPWTAFSFHPVEALVQAL